MLRCDFPKEKSERIAKGRKYLKLKTENREKNQCGGSGRTDGNATEKRYIQFVS